MRTSQTIGAKTLKLSDLISLGLNVPKFKAIDSHELNENIENLEAVAEKIHKELNCEKYAVRSSALIEDSQKESYAGQFKTIIDVEKDDLALAIKEITDHAKKLLGGSAEKFSVLVQQYIEADISGVTFTRNPTSGREMLIEHHKGRGEELVSGNILPEKLEIYWTNIADSSALPGLEKAVKDFKEVEKFYEFPQDIEWCIKDKVWYFLQTRPITTISENQYKQSLYLDETLPSGDFHYEKTEISEIAARPTQITQDLLEKIYEENGPIHEVYKKFKINYSSKDILKIVGNELFVDREEELKSFTQGLFTKIKNAFSLNKIKLDKHDANFEDLKNAIENKEKISTIEEFLKIFEKDYQIVFEINLLAGISIKKVESLMKNELPLSLILSWGDELFQDEQNYKLELSTENLTGNTIEISDESEFIRNISKKKENKEVREWWGKLSEVKKTMFKKKIEQASIYNRFREMSRWLVVKRISQLREILFEIAEKNNFKDKRTIYFAKLEEITDGGLSEELCEKRKQQYEKYADFNMPKTLSNKPRTQKQKTQGISPGKAEGVLVEVAEIDAEKYKNKDKILLTRVLSPELVKHFDKIKGIVSEQGGFLSHLAIMARERGVPVVSEVAIGDFEKGEKVAIDGDTGEILHRKIASKYI